MFTNVFNNFTGGLESASTIGSFISTSGNLDIFAIANGSFWHYSGGVWTNKGAINNLSNACNNYVTYRGLLYFGSGNPGGQFYTWDGATLSIIGSQVGGYYWGSLADHIVVAHGSSNYSGLTSNSRGIVTGKPIILSVAPSQV